jgi:hypothetical protein
MTLFRLAMKKVCSNKRDIADHLPLTSETSISLFHVDRYYVRTEDGDGRWDGYLTGREFNYAHQRGELNHLPREIREKLSELYIDARFNCIEYSALKYFEGFSPSDPSISHFRDLSEKRRNEILHGLQEEKKGGGPFTPQDGYRFALQGIQPGSLPPIPSDEVWKTADVKFLKTESKAAYAYVEVNFRDASTSQYSDPDLAMTPDFDVILSYSQLKARRDFDKLLARAGIDKIVSVSPSGETITTYEASGFPISTFFALLQVQREAFFADGSINDQLKGAFESKDVIPLRWSLHPFERTGTLKCFRATHGMMLEIEAKIAFREGGLEIDDADLLEKLKKL